MFTADITDRDLRAFAVVERVVSVFSLLGCVFVIASFSMSKAFQHKPINRLVFYASIGNMMTNVATLMARSYVGSLDSAGCQFQAFLIQMFMPADAFWTLAMAVNVYLTFYYKYDAQKLRKMEIPYLLCCYGIPFIVALTYIFIKTESKGRMYGNATIWCWVSTPWDIWRIVTFYGPVWVVMVVTTYIYIRAGREIYIKHRQLKDLNYTSHYDVEPLAIHNPFNTKTTEVTVSVSDAPETIDLSPLGVGSNEQPPGRPQLTAAYSVSISARPATASGSGPAATTTTTTSPTGLGSGATLSPPQPRSRHKAAVDANNAAWSYTKVAMLFFTAMLVTWIPSSANRLYSLAMGGQVSLPLLYMSAFVLPLQGFWNAIIYCTTSWKACKMLGEDVALLFSSKQRMPSRAAAKSTMPSTGGLAGVLRNRSRLGTDVRSGKDSETESMEELADRSGSSSA